VTMAADDARVTVLKPAFGESCNGCGFCCETEPCALAKSILRCTSGPCVALEYEGGRTYCGLVRHPLHHLWNVAHPTNPMSWRDASGASDDPALSVQIASMLRLGAGCDADD
jgi:hypothetical protein